MKKSSILFVCAALAALPILTIQLSGCDKSAKEGGFGDAPVAQPGVHVKPSAQKGPPNFIGAIRLAPTFDAATQTVNVNLQIKPGFHAYAPGEEIGKPVDLVVRETNGWKAKGKPSIPAGKKKELGTLGTSYVLQGPTPMSIGITGGKGNVEGHVAVQVCNDTACDRPRKHRFELATN